MTDVGLYGDSFGTGSLPKLPNGSYDTGFDFHWSKLLEKEFNWNITNYAESGSSIFESYSNFVDNHNKYEKNLFIITTPGRYHAPLKFKSYKHIIPEDVTTHIVNLSHLEVWYNINRDYMKEEDHELIRDLKGWYMMQNYTYEITTCKLMIEDIKKIRPDTILIRVSDFNVTENFPLGEIYRQQCKLLGFDSSNLHTMENTALISGHFTPEINKLVAEYIKDRVITGKWQDWKIPNNFSFVANKKVYFGV